MQLQRREEEKQPKIQKSDDGTLKVISLQDGLPLLTRTSKLPVVRRSTFALRSPRL
jgi:hypothetical protein